MGRQNVGPRLALPCAALSCSNRYFDGEEMASTVGWLDTSPETQQRVRELIALFSEKRTLDELGIGQIRDVFSDALFPGTSTIQTRARYLLLVPWAYLAPPKKWARTGSLQARADELQRDTIATLKEMAENGEQHDGIIGRRSGKGIGTLPSSIYWTALLAYGLLQKDVPEGDLRGSRATASESDELTERTRGEWHPELRRLMPEGFPHKLPAGLDLSREEAIFLRERISDSQRGTLLAGLVSATVPLDPGSVYPWTDSTVAAVVGEDDANSGPRAMLIHAERFSRAIRGASLLYGAVLAEEKNRLLGSEADRLDTYVRSFEEWCDEMHQLGDLRDWDQGEFWQFVQVRNPRVSLRTKAFVAQWFKAIVEGRVRGAIDDPELRAFVRDREIQVKGSQARLANPKRLSQWEGNPAQGLQFRWSTVKRIITDIHEGILREGAADAES